MGRQSGWASAGACAVAVGLVCVGCGGTGHTARPFVIEPQTIVTADGGTTQFSVSTSDPSAPGTVLWGVDTSPMEPPAVPPVSTLKVSDNGRYLVDQDGAPWRVQADAAWLMSSEATPNEVEQYLDTRRAQGFNSFYLMAMVHPRGYGAGEHAPDNWRGDPPFATAGDFSTAGASPTSERYWEWIDWIVAQAAARDMVVMLSYTYLGWSGGDMGWYAEVLAQPDRQALFNWGKWLGTRYKDAANVIWFGLGDFAPPAGSEGAARVVEIAKGIRAAGATQLFMAEASPPDTLPVEDADFGPYLDIDSFYGYGPDGTGPVYMTASRSWKFTPTKPAFMEEGTYEYENNWGHFSGKPWDTRRGRFWSVLGGAVAGDGFGSRDVWQWNDLPKSLDSPGARYSSIAFDFFASLPWWDLSPGESYGKGLVTSGQDQWGGLGYITSARSSDGHWVVVYTPVTSDGVRTFSIDMSALSGPARARWFDPSTGNYLDASNGYEYQNSGERSFITPGDHADGTNDWVLVLDATNDSPCGSVNSSGLYTAPSSAPVDVVCELSAMSADDPAASARTRLVFSGG